ncbi:MULTISPECIES: hypothetical protein [unclassified Agrobacterium]|uniref:hypothetical protein n=1 Tax=unclassified Agrobacterium TaxID=2632611 RepID=UPI00083E32AA|nr:MULTISPECIES: hypothetical protein [unclassified Agrobacterium]AOG12572.1 hypothetical protein BSY240_4537 [Agrobacterium sp. RAC06]QGG93475.1 hypothetical protein GH983_23430 [Agrobacterium sp. MA01]
MRAIEVEDRCFKIETAFGNNPEEPKILEFSVELRQDGAAHDIVCPAILGYLGGFVVRAGYLPQGDDNWYFDIFDMRSGHAMEAFHILADERSLLRRALGRRGVLDECTCVAHLEQISVHPSLYGHGVELRLIREAQRVLARPGLLAVMKAHPQGASISDVDCARLAAHYQSDHQLGFIAISQQRYPGWLAAIWNRPLGEPADETVLHRLT